MDSKGDIFKVRGNSEVAELDSSGHAINEDLNGCNENCASPTTGLAVDSSDGDVYVSHSKYISRYSSSGALLEPSFGEPHLTDGGAVAVKESSGRAYAFDTGASAVDFFDPVAVPALSTGSASKITNTTAKLVGEVKPAVGEEVISCRFEYVTEAAFEAHRYAGAAERECSPATPYSTEMDVSVELTGLSVSTLYHYRLVAVNASGDEALGQDRSFHTNYRPQVQAAFVTGLGETTATLGGSVNPEAAKAEYQVRICHQPHWSIHIRWYPHAAL